MQQMIQLLAGSGNSQVHGAVGLALGPCSIQGGGRMETAEQALESARPGFGSWSAAF